MLWRALSQVDNGFYIDVGAHHPTIDSVSLAFYQRGWRGLDIEPVPEYAALLRQHRPENQVVEAVISNTTGSISLTVVPDTGWSTASEEVAKVLNSEHPKTLNTCVLEVEQIRLADLAHFYSGRPVHWMKVDVEGFEREVLEGWDPATLRPWLLVIEATFPNSSQPNFASWEPIVVGAGYQCVYRDGLNRFYLANEHSDLADAFRYPPNVFDDIRLRPHSAMLQDLAAEHMKDIQVRTAAYQRQIISLQHYQAKYEAIVASASWRLTAPLRRLLTTAMELRSLAHRWLAIKGWRNRVKAASHLLSIFRQTKFAPQSGGGNLELSLEGRRWLEELEKAAAEQKN